MIAPWTLLVLAAASPRVLTLQDALQTADERQPDLRAEAANVDVLWGRSDEARSPLLPQLNVAAYRQWSTGNYTPRPGALPTSVGGGTGSAAATSGPSGTLHNSYSATATANQL